MSLRDTFNKPKIEKFFNFFPACTDENGILDLQTIRTNGRFYITPDGNEYPSMTTILGATAEKGYLDEWRDKIGHSKADRITNLAAARGSNLHEIAELYVLGNPDYLKNAMPLGRKLFSQIKPFIDQHLGIVYGIEQALYSDQHKVAGRTDVIGVYRGKTSIVDYKSSLETKPENWIQEYFVQGAGYGTLFNWMVPEFEIEQIAVLIGVENSLHGQEFVVPFHDYKEQFEMRVSQFYES